MQIDRSQLHAQESIDLEVTMPNGASTDMVIHLRSMESPEVKRILRKWDKMASRSRKSGLDFDQKEQASIELLAACVIGWEGYTDSGDPIVFSDEEALDLITNPATRFIRSQIDDKVGDVASFLRVDGTS